MTKPIIFNIVVASSNKEEIDAIMALIYDSENTSCFVISQEKQQSTMPIIIDHPMIKRGRWHHKDIAVLTQLYEEDMPIQDICSKLGRTFNSVQSKISEIGLRSRKVRNQFGS